MSFVLVSTVVMALNTMQGLKVIMINLIHFSILLYLQVMNEKGVLLPHPFLELIEAICIAWFTLEYIVRLDFIKEIGQKPIRCKMHN